MLTPENIEKMIALISRDNITLALSIFGSLGTLFTLFHNFFINRKNVNVRIVGYRFGDDKSLLIYVALENISRLPVSITGFAVNIDSTWYPCAEPSVTAFEETFRTGGVVTSHHEYKTLSLPIYIASLGGTSGYIFFEMPEATFQTDTTSLKFLINSNRGLIMKRTLSLGRHLG